MPRTLLASATTELRMRAAVASNSSAEYKILEVVAEAEAAGVRHWKRTGACGLKANSWLSSIKRRACRSAMGNRSDLVVRQAPLRSVKSCAAISTRTECALAREGRRSCTVSDQPEYAICVREHDPRELRRFAIVVGLPKSGTTSLFKFFRCGNWKATHGDDCRSRLIDWYPRGRPCFACVNEYLDYMSLNVLPPAGIGPAATLPNAVQQIRNASAARIAFKYFCGPHEAFTQIDYPFGCHYPQHDKLALLVASLRNEACFILNYRPTSRW
eukprot:2850662-Prymnesium_polylepis.1